MIRLVAAGILASIAAWILILEIRALRATPTPTSLGDEFANEVYTYLAQLRDAGL